MRILESSLRMCNLQRDETSILGLPDPCQVAFNDCLRIMADGRIEALNADGEKLKQILRLDSEKNVRDRYAGCGLLRRSGQGPRTLPRIHGFPEDLPDLRIKQVPDNTRPDGDVNCHFALRERGELPATY